MAQSREHRTQASNYVNPRKPFFSKQDEHSFFRIPCEIGHISSSLQRSPRPLLRTNQPLLSRFSDSVHHQVEEYALTQAGLDAGAIVMISQADSQEKRQEVKRRYGLRDEQIDAIRQAGIRGALRLNKDQIAGVHRGNTQRDYSQVPAIGNLALLHRPRSFGGYRAREHFDNFVYDIQTGRWRSRGAATRFKFDDVSHPDSTPIDYMREQFYSLADIWENRDIDDATKMVHVGNAFHTVEDFFAHSNFVELIQNDKRHGAELITGSVGGDNSVDHILSSISATEMREYYHRRAERGAEQTPRGSHARMAKDHPGAYNFGIARRLATLVIQQLSTDLLIAMLPETAEQRKRLIESTLMRRINRYIRPPQSSDPWWKELQSKAPVNIDGELNRIQHRTPVTVNQGPLSPLRNIEASSHGAMRFPLGVAVPVQLGDTHVWIQAGALGVIQSPQIGTDEPEQSGFVLGGLQVGGRF